MSTPYTPPYVYTVYTTICLHVHISTTVTRPECLREMSSEYASDTWTYGRKDRRTLASGYDAAKNDFLFEKRLNDRLYEVVMNHFCSKPTLVFCNSRDGCMAAAKAGSRRRNTSTQTHTQTQNTNGS